MSVGQPMQNSNEYKEPKEPRMPKAKNSSGNEGGVLVKFNCTHEVHMIPDEKYEIEKETLEKMRYNDYKSFQQRLAAGSPFERKMFKIGEVGLIPEWYYKAHKDDTVKISVAFDNFKNEEGNRIPFHGKDAHRHGYIKDPKDTMQTVKLFEKVKKEKEAA